MDATAKAEFKQLSKTLRSQLKAWENEWAISHNRKKPGKGDIKQNPDIARKYKEYQQIRDILTGKEAPPSVSPKKRKPAQSHATPSKRAKHATTPSKSPSRPDEEDEPFSPIIPRYLFSPAPPSSLGPTPQRDGRALGLFDLLSSGGGSPSGADLETPSRRGRNNVAATLAAAQATPTRGAARAEANPRKPWRTPMSASKRQLLNNFLTPLKNGDGNVLAGAKTPSSTGVSKLQFDTPAFLRRAPPPKMDENGIEFSNPAPLRLPRKPLGRGLSAIVASLRRVEEEVLDEELDALREMEAEEMGVPRPPTANSESTAANEGAVRAPGTKSQAPILLGGFDDEALRDSTDEEQVSRDDQPLRLFKKKGQKRTTKLFKMKPTRFKRPATTNAGQADVGNGGDEDGPTAVNPADTGIGIHQDQDDELPEPGSDFEPSEDDDNETSRTSRTSRMSKAGKAGKKKNKNTNATEAKPGDGTEERVGVVKKAVRKVNAMAHANFRRLKLRNNGSKGGPGYNSRFRRRK